MIRLTLKIIMAGSVAALTGCMSADSDTVRVEGVWPGAGDAVARNTVLQIVDPWPEGVEDTNLNVPADRPDADAGAPELPAASTGMAPKTN